MHNVADYQISTETGHLALANTDPAADTISCFQMGIYTVFSTVFFPLTFAYGIIEALGYLLQAGAANLELSRVTINYDAFSTAVADHSDYVHFEGESVEEQFDEFPQLQSDFIKDLEQYVLNDTPENRAIISAVEAVDTAYKTIAPEKLAKQLRMVERDQALYHAKCAAMYLIPFVGVWLANRNAQAGMNADLAPSIAAYNGVVGDNKELRPED
ncbi:MAG: hypothetical protein P0S94_00470 [Simkaniaceae bacterium]|nr:hypothetical protein [Simkaniaceae bacterium]